MSVMLHVGYTAWVTCRLHCMGNDPKPPPRYPQVCGETGVMHHSLPYAIGRLWCSILCVILLRIVLNGSRTAKCHNSRFANIRAVMCRVVTATFFKGGQYVTTKMTVVFVTNAPRSVMWVSLRVPDGSYGPY